MMCYNYCLLAFFGTFPICLPVRPLLARALQLIDCKHMSDITSGELTEKGLQLPPVDFRPWT